MPKLDLDTLRKMDEIAKALQAQVMVILAHIAQQGMFCDHCGDTEPEHGFYPLGIVGMGRISGFLCSDCAIRHASAEKEGGAETECWPARLCNS
jgi:hypothetical protein